MYTQNMQRNSVKNIHKNVLVRAFKILLPNTVINLVQIKSYKNSEEKKNFSDVNYQTKKKQQKIITQESTKGCWLDRF